MLRFVVGVMFLALFVMVVEFGHVRGRVDALETGGASALAPATQDPLGSPQSFKVVLKEMEVVPKAVEVPAGTPLTLNVVNQGQTMHNLALDGGPKTPDLKTGQTATLKVGTVTKAMTGACSIPGRKEAGMTFEVRLSGAAYAATAAAAEHANASARRQRQARSQRHPAGRLARLRPRAGARARGPRAHAHAARHREGHGGGAWRHAGDWAFNDKVPGPALRGKVGDMFTVTLVNDGKLGHSIDFHASKVAWNDEMRTIQPGESLVYQFEAKHAGVFMYHCGTAPTLHHIGNGMYGAIIIDPPDLAPVDHEFVLVQSELYLGPEGQPGDLDQDAGRAAATPSCSTATSTSTSTARSGSSPDERVRVWVLDAGPSENSAFHIVGTIFDTVFKEGSYLLQPGRAGGAARRRSTSSRPRAASSSSPSTRPACTRS